MDFTRISEGVFGFFKDISPRSKTNVLYIVLILGFGIYLIERFNVFDKRLDEINEKEIEVDFKPQILDREDGHVVIANEDLLTKMRDSIKTANKSEIKDMCKDLVLEMSPYCNYVSYWKIHNDGKPIRTGDRRPYFYVILSSDRDIAFDFKDDKKLHGGYFEMAKITKEVEIYTLKDAVMRHNVHYDETAEIMDRLGTKSMVWACVKSDDYEWYFASFSFNRILTDDDEKIYEEKIIDFKRYILRRT